LRSIISILSDWVSFLAYPNLFGIKGFVVVYFLSHLGSDFGDIFDIDYFIERTKGYVRVVKELPDELKSKEPFKVDCSKRKGQFDYVETVLPSLLQHRYISFTPAMSQRRDRYLLFYPDHGLKFSIISINNNIILLLSIGQGVMMIILI
jgi:hypothetical protein